MMLERLRAAMAHMIAPEVRKRHALALRTVQENCTAQITCANQIRDNFQSAVTRSNDQSEALYADAFLHLPDRLQRKWVGIMGAPNLAFSYDPPIDLNGIEVTEFHDREGI